MSDTTRGVGQAGDEPTKPWTVNKLAEWDAGSLDETQAAELWEHVREDSEAMAVMAGLQATKADLAGLRHEVPAMPATVAARIDDALANEFPPDPDTGPRAPVVDLSAARARHRRFASWAAGAVATAAAVAALAVIVPNSTTAGTPIASAPGPDADAPPITLQEDSPEAALDGTFDIWDYGPLGDRAALDECLRANGVDPDVRPAGVREGMVDGEQAVVVVLTTGEPAEYRLLALPAECGPDNPGLLFDDVVGFTG